MQVHGRDWLGCHAALQEVSRRHTRPPPSLNKAAHSETSPEIQNRGIRGPTKRTYVLQNLKKKEIAKITLRLSAFFVEHYESDHPVESSENTAICAKIRKFVRGFEELLPVAILDQ